MFIEEEEYLKEESNSRRILFKRLSRPVTADGNQNSLLNLVIPSPALSIKEEEIRRSVEATKSIIEQSNK